MLKLVYLAKRKPGFAFDDFVRRWRMHGARGMEGSFWRHALAYVQAEPLRPTPVAGTSEAFDAIAIFAVRDDAFAAMTPDDIAGAKTMAQDELETFSAPIPTTPVTVTLPRGWSWCCCHRRCPAAVTWWSRPTGVPAQGVRARPPVRWRR